ncbi:helix-turn-helix transcriptional regulator [Acinetobacter baumannii]|uniref:helix-turn-helix transcriptional regulator n=1 Tax=Acinetobacter baumannii TaxID=470 RepID=UPI0037DE2429
MLNRNNHYDSVEFLAINKNTIDGIDPVNIIHFMDISSAFIALIKLDEYKRCKNIKLIDIYNSKEGKIELSDYHFKSINDFNNKNIKIFKVKDNEHNIFEIFSTYVAGNNLFLISVRFINLIDYNSNLEKLVNLFPLFFNWLIKNKIKKNIEKIVTKKEKIILSYVVCGKTNWEMARILNISENSIKFHLKNLFKKTNSNNRSHLVSIAFKYNLVDLGNIDFDLMDKGCDLK